MPKQIKIQKSFQECLSKIKVANKQLQFQIRACKHPKTPSFATAKDTENDGITLSDIDQFLFENFRSLYQKEYEDDIAKKNNDNPSSKPSPFPLHSPRFAESPPLETLHRSARFFINRRSSSSLITDDGFSSSETEEFATDGSSSTAEEDHHHEGTEDQERENNESFSRTPDDFIALLTYSPTPYEEFRRSMQEMVEARLEHNGKVDWEFMQELLFCYLDLNNKKSYRFILKAFVDLIVGLRDGSGKVPASTQPWRGGGGGKKR